MLRQRSWQGIGMGSLTGLALACGSAPSSPEPGIVPTDSTTSTSAPSPSVAPTPSTSPISSVTPTPSASVTSSTQTGPSASSAPPTSSESDESTSADGSTFEGPTSNASGAPSNENTAEPAPSTPNGESEATTAEGEATSGEQHTATDGCPHRGTVSYTFNNPDSWPEEVRQKLTAALDEAVYYYNCYSDLTKTLNINYKPDVPTAEGNVDGWISFGSDRNYMQTATAMHEIGHTMGVGYAPWSELIQDGRWTGPAVSEFMAKLPADQRDPDMYSQRTYITCDTQHFWPYGLNQASEHQSEWSLVNHVKIVAAMNADKAAAR